MDPVKHEKFEVMNNYYNKRMHLHQPSLKNTKSNDDFIVYVLTTLTCGLVFFSPFWYPSFESLVISIPTLISHFLSSPKCLFIVGNLIVLGLVGESKLLTSKASEPADSHEVYYDEYVSRRQIPMQQRPVKADNAVVHKECKKVCEVTRSAARSRSVPKVESGKGNKGFNSTKGSVVRTLSAEELSKRADDFIARVNRHRRLEATDLVEWGI